MTLQPNASMISFPLMFEHSIGNCCHVSWINSCRKTSASIFVAAAFPNGVAIYAVPTSGSTDFPLQPLAIMKTDHLYTCCMTAWTEIPKYPPCLSIFLSNRTKSLMIHGMLGLPTKDYGGDIKSKEVRFQYICKDELPIGEITPWTDIYCFEDLKAVISCENGDIIKIIPSSRHNGSRSCHTIHPFISLLSQPVASNALGVTSMGFVEQETSMNDDVLHVHSQLEWEIRSDRDEEGSIPSIVIPSLSQWLCKTNAGDKKSDKKTKHDSTQGRESVPSNGVITEVVCELKCYDPLYPHLIPTRIVRSNFGCLCAVFFVPLFTPDGGRDIIVTESDPKTFTLINYGEKNVETVQHVNGRDVVFIEDNTEKKLLILDKDGIGLGERLMSDISVEHERKVRIFRKGSSYDDSLNTHRLFLTSTYSLLLLCSRKADSRYLLLLGGKWGQFARNDECFIDGKSCKFWFHEGERFVSLVELPSSHSNIVKVAVSTTSRVLLLCCNASLNILAEYALNASCSSLVPLGSSCVSFIDSQSNKQRIQYLSHFQGEKNVGTIANLPTGTSHLHNLFLAVRPDRAVYNSIITECNHYTQTIVRVPFTKPLFLLEPLIANILGETYSETSEMPIKLGPSLDSLMERFGVKLDSNPHGEKEGIGTKGMGYTTKVLQMLRNCGYYDDFVTKHLNKGETLMPWIPVTEKIDSIEDCEDVMKLISNGDENLWDYVKTRDRNKSCVLPKPLDSISFILSSYSTTSLHKDRLDNAIRAMDLLGSSSSYLDLGTIFRINQILSRTKASTAALSESYLRDFNSPVPLHFNKSFGPSQKSLQEEQKQSELVERRKYMPQLAPNYRRGICQTGRASNYLIEHSVYQLNKQHGENKNRKIANDESKHVWHAGPFDDREQILLLDSIEQWLGRCHPTVLGKEGAEIAAESGQIALKNILAAAAATEATVPEDGSHTEDSQCSSMEGWVEGVGEGLDDEEKLSLYFRFFEGVDEDSEWRVKGLSDLSTFQNKPKVINTDILTIEATTSNVDEGEEGSVRLLHDLVWRSDVSEEETAGLLFEVKRGSSLDIGLFHSDFNRSRQRATLEFWYYLPRHDLDEIVLARRSMCYQNEEDIESLCCKAEKNSMLWELVVLSSGRLEFRSCGGDVLDTSKTVSNGGEQSVTKQSIVNPDNSYDEEFDAGLVSWPREDGYGGWNHVAVTFACDDLCDNECKVTIAMKGIEIVSSTISFQLPTSSLGQEGAIDVEDALSFSALMFGLGGLHGFRLTELRLWAVARPIDDLNRMMCEYLDAATIKKKRKFKMAIRSKEFQKITPPRIAKPKKLVAPNENDSRMRKVNTNESDPLTHASFADFDHSFDNLNNSINEEDHSHFEAEDTTKPIDDSIPSAYAVEQEEVLVEQSIVQEPNYTVLESCLLSDDLRKSAAAAFIRGGPATRHFGGNRGGLPEKKLVANILMSLIVCFCSIFSSL